MAGSAVGPVAGNAVLGDADIPARRHLRAGIGGDDGDVGQFRHRTRGFGKPDRRAAADHDEAVGIKPLQFGKDVLERLARHGLPAGVAEADNALGDRGDDGLGEFGAGLRAQDDDAREFVAVGLRAQRLGRARPEHDADRVGVIGECIGHFGFLMRGFPSAFHPPPLSRGRMRQCIFAARTRANSASSLRGAERRSNPGPHARLDCFASLAMTDGRTNQKEGKRNADRRLLQPAVQLARPRADCAARSPVGVPPRLFLELSEPLRPASGQASWDSTCA